MEETLIEPTFRWNPESAGEGSKKTDPHRAVELDGHRRERTNGTDIRSGRYSRGTDIRRT